GAPNRIAGDMVVRELVAADPEARAAICGWIASLADQYQRVFIMLPRGESMLTHTRAPAVDVPFFYRFHRAARTIAGEMVRIVRLSDAFGAHPVPARSGVSGTVGLDLTDPVFSDQNGPFDLTVDAKGARVKKGRTSKARIA